ncbi:hypothetical protein T484DRAFT_1893113, partial [Baffinella frigidus]
MAGGAVKKKAGKLAAVKPLNLAEEEAKFLADETYQPRFKYRDGRAAAEACASMAAKDEYALLAVRVLDRVIRQYGSESAYHAAAYGEVMSREQVAEMTAQYLEGYGFTSAVKVSWTSDLVTWFSHGKATSTLHLVSRPGYYRRHRLRGLLDHEIGTHYLRARNRSFS